MARSNISSVSVSVIDDVIAKVREDFITYGSATPYSTSAKPSSPGSNPARVAAIEWPCPRVGVLGRSMTSHADGSDAPQAEVLTVLRLFITVPSFICSPRVATSSVPNSIAIRQPSP